MIVRIMGEGQYEVADERVAELNRYDDRIEAAIAADDETAFRDALTALLDAVRASGAAVPDDVIEPSQLILPRPGADVDEVRELLGDGGLIPG